MKNSNFYMYKGEINLHNPIYLQEKGDKKGNIYKLESFRVSDTALLGTLELMCGWDYVDIDYSDAQGWVSADWFIEDYQFDNLSVYLWEESIMESIEDNGWAIVDLPKKIKVYDKHKYEKLKEGKGYTSIEDKDGFEDALENYDTFRDIMNIAIKNNLEVVEAQIYNSGKPSILISDYKNKYINLHYAPYTKGDWKFAQAQYNPTLYAINDEILSLDKEFSSFSNFYKSVKKLDLYDLPTSEYLIHGDTKGEDDSYVIVNTNFDPEPYAYTSSGWTPVRKVKDKHGLTLNQAENSLDKFINKEGYSEEDLEIVHIEDL